MTETVEYTAANLTDKQRAYCEGYEAEHENNQVRVERFTEDGSVLVHLHGTEQAPRVVSLSKDGQVVEEGEG